MTSSSPKSQFIEAFPRPAEYVPPAGFATAHHIELPIPAQPAPAGPAGSTGPAGSAEHADKVTLARFDVDLREPATLPGEVAARLRAEAQATGYATGWAHGRREAVDAARVAHDQAAAQTQQATAEQSGRVSRALAALAGAASGLERRMTPVAADLEDMIVGLAFDIAEAVIGRELALAVEPGRDAVARALASAPTGRPVSVRLHPSDYATVTQGQSRIVEIEGRTVSLSADATLRPGDAVAECDATTIDARVEPALARVREVLGL